jgi:hypothetical protein
MRAGVIDPNPITSDLRMKLLFVADNFHATINCWIEATHIKKVEVDNILPIAISFN